MKKLVVTDRVHHCDLDEIELNSYEVKFKLKAGNRAQAGRFRFVTPTAETWQKCFEMEVAPILLNEIQRADGNERHFWKRVFNMLRLNALTPDMDTKCERRFRLTSFDKSKSMAKIAKFTGAGGVSAHERLKRFAGSVVEPASRLITKAVYERPDFKLPIPAGAYVPFRDGALSDFEDTVEQIEQLGRRVLENKKREIETDPTLSPDHRQELLSRVAAIEAGEDDECLESAFQASMALVFDHALEKETEEAAYFAEIVEKVRRVQEPVVREISRKGIEILSKDRTFYTPDVLALISKTLDVETVNELLSETMNIYKARYGSELPSDDQIEAALESNDPCIAQFCFLWLAYDGDDIRKKWTMLCWIGENLIDRTECYRLLQREAENVWLGVHDYAAKQIYRKVRKHLAPIERRAFILLNFGLAVFNGRPLIFDPVLQSFFLGMDKDTQGLVILLLLPKRERSAHRDDWEKELELRWKSFLRFYPIWLLLIRDEEREEKRTKREKPRMLRLDLPIRSAEGEDKTTFHDVVPDPKSMHIKMLQTIVLRREGKLTEWFSRYCTETQGVYILAKFVLEQTEKEIGKAHGVSQQAVSKAILAGMVRIKTGLERDGMTKASLLES